MHLAGFFILMIMIFKITPLPTLYNKVYIEIIDGKNTFTKVVSKKEAEEIERDLKGI